MENVLSPLNFFHKITYCCSQGGLGMDMKFGLYEQRLQAPKDLQGRTANKPALGTEALASPVAVAWAASPCPQQPSRAFSV